MKLNIYLLSFAIFILVASISYAQRYGSDVDMQGNKSPDQDRDQDRYQNMTMNQTRSTNMTPILNQTQIRERNYAHIQNYTVSRQAEMYQESLQLSYNERLTYQNQNRARLALEILSNASDIEGNASSQISIIAKELNNSMQRTIRAENSIRSRSAFSRMFAGGDAKSAGLLIMEIQANRERIRELNTLVNECECDEQARIMLQEQIRNIEAEQNRLQEMAQQETRSKGLFGWIWK